jgi:mannose-6-phosphate isomerase
LQIEQALACVDFAQGPVSPVSPTVQNQEPGGRERLVACRQFQLWHIRGALPFTIGAPGQARVAVCIEGRGVLQHGGIDYIFGKGDVMLLPAVVGACQFQPGVAAEVLEIAMPEAA